MKKIDLSNRIPVKLWLDDIELGAMQQAGNLANLPFAGKHIAIMPDAHQGYGMPIGGVLATKGVVIPNAVGVDIGCGMIAYRTYLDSITTDQLKQIMGIIRDIVPVGPKRHKAQAPINSMPDSKKFPAFDGAVFYGQYQAARKQMGTLGGGNHFIEIQKGSDGHIWIMIHSGSRNLGKRVADHYNELAKRLNERWFSNVPAKADLAFLPLQEKCGQDYMAEMAYCNEFARLNRILMLNRILVHAFEDLDKDILWDNPEINHIECSHNFARMEHHYGKNYLIHRKGATPAYSGHLGIIPGSQGTKSYIVRGKGNRESFMSCSHGAGRKMSRSAARNTLDLNEQISAMDKLGVVHGIRGAKDLDEAPGAYKDIDVVMKNQTDLVDIEVELTPLAVIKG